MGIPKGQLAHCNEEAYQEILGTRLLQIRSQAHCGGCVIARVSLRRTRDLLSDNNRREALTRDIDRFHFVPGICMPRG